jgi:hypothetical protein
MPWLARFDWYGVGEQRFGGVGVLREDAAADTAAGVHGAVSEPERLMQIALDVAGDRLRQLGCSGVPVDPLTGEVGEQDQELVAAVPRHEVG